MVKLPGKRFEGKLIRGFLHEPVGQAVSAPHDDALALTHGAGGNCESPLLLALADVFAAAGWHVLRYDLPFRIQGKSPSPAQAVRDREGIREAASALREASGARGLSLSGSSYGGRQSTMLAAEDATIAQALLLLSYPLHPPGKPLTLRTEHFPALRTPALFAHGTRDAFGSIDELRAAIALIPARTELIEIAGAPHGLPPKSAASVASQFIEFVAR
jgi:predicted alpha/beta-hydrolase family hydrolase